MFGLMRPASCHRKVPESRYRRRLHYCGTCKAIGKLYGHRYRLLLNHDTVFLAEMLSVWTGEDATLSEWDAALQSHNCLRTPERTPFCLEYAATATLLLGDFKLLDHAADSRNRFWRWLHRRCSPEFRAASERLERWGFPTAELRDILASQQDRERRGWSDDDVPSDRMKFLAEPTARATALFFRHGARLTGGVKMRRRKWATRSGLWSTCSTRWRISKRTRVKGRSTRFGRACLNRARRSRRRGGSGRSSVPGRRRRAWRLL
jgi:hypothetical protein